MSELGLWNNVLYALQSVGCAYIKLKEEKKQFMYENTLGDILWKTESEKNMDSADSEDLEKL